MFEVAAEGAFRKDYYARVFFGCVTNELANRAGIPGEVRQGSELDGRYAQSGRRTVRASVGGKGERQRNQSDDIFH
jgi:hypothetical protein